MANLDSALYGTQKTEFWLGINAKLSAESVATKQWYLFPNDSGTVALKETTQQGVPLFIAAGEKFVVHANTQVLWSLPVEVEGELEINGAFVEAS